MPTFQKLILPTAFFSRSVLTIAPELLGKFLVTPSLVGMITEVEAYDGPHDLACHGRFGPTKRTGVMFGPAGYWYAYLCYGMHWMLNIVCREEGYPAAVLIRGVKTDSNLNGPGKVTAAFGIDRSFSGKISDPASDLWIEDRGVALTKNQILRTPRIGVDYAGAWAKKPYRYMVKL